MSIPFIEDNDQTRARQEHLDALRVLVGNAYPNKFERSQLVEAGKEDTITAVVEKFRAFEPKATEGERPPAEAIELANQQLSDKSVRIAGRIATPPRVMGKAAFVHLSDGVTRLQIYVKRADVTGVSNDAGGGEVDGWELFNLLDHGDFIGVEGYLFITRTGELSIHVQKLQFLAKALLALPDKMHGINDPEIRQRQRYADLIAGSLKLDFEKGELTPRQVFERRSKIITEMRHFLESHGYVEVETPMLTPLATGAAAKPFATRHLALGIPLYARIAPELYLKRLLVGGFEKVYELNRNFRNEGISTRHNPEFTMLEFYWAYADVNQMMDFCEELIRRVVHEIVGGTRVTFPKRPISEGSSIHYPYYDFDVARFDRLTMKEAIRRHWLRDPFLEELDFMNERMRIEWLDDPAIVRMLYRFKLRETYTIAEHLVEEDGLDPDDPDTEEAVYLKAWEIAKREYLERRDIESGEEYGKHLVFLFEEIAERNLKNPTFITDFPKSVSPLSKASPADPKIAERFELFIEGMECANGFSELNDPKEQYERFKDQVSQRERGDDEAMVMDEDYIRALSYGMPPAAGIGIGIDRFVMLLTNRQSIRDVILFPHLRPERKHGETAAGEDQNTGDQTVPPSGG